MATKNWAYSLVATAPSPATSGTSLVVTAADGTKFYVGKAWIWPTGVQPTTANAEVVNITAISTDTLTITRAQEGSSARTVVIGDQIAQGLTAAMFDALVDLTSTQTLSHKTFSDQITSTLATGTAPLSVASTTKVTNLNADQVDGIHASTTATASQLMPLDSNAKYPTTLLTNPYKFRAYRNAAQNGTSAAYAIVNFDTKEYDTGSNFDVTTNVGRFTAPVAGFYSFSWMAGWSGANGSGGDNVVVSSLYKNGVIAAQGTTNTTRASTATANTLSGGSTTLQLAANDFIEVYTYANTGPIALKTGSAYCYISGNLVSAT